MYTIFINFFKEFSTICLVATVSRLPMEPINFVAPMTSSNKGI